MHPADAARWHLTEADSGALASFQAVTRKLKWDRKTAERAIDAFAGLPPDVRTDPAKLTPEVVRIAEQMGLSLPEYDAMTNWLCNAMTVGAPPVSTPSAEQDAARAAEIRQARAADPDGYDKDGWADRDEHAIIERRGAAVPARVDEKPTLATPSGAAARLAEIRQFRRDNPDGWDADRKMQAEELQLLATPSAQVSATPAPTETI